MLSLYYWAYRLFMKLPQGIRYILVGSFNTVFGIGLFEVNLYFFDHLIHYLLILFLSSFISISVSFVTLKYYVFNIRGDWKKQYGRNLMVQLAALCLNAVLLSLVVDGFDFSPYYAQPVIVFFIALGTYVAHKVFSFKE